MYFVLLIFGRLLSAVLLHMLLCRAHLSLPQEDMSVGEESRIFNQPENACRLAVLLSPAGLFRTLPFDDLSWRAAPVVAMADLLRVHEYKYVAHIRAICDELKLKMKMRGEPCALPQRKG